MSVVAPDEMEGLATRLYPILRDWPDNARPDRTTSPENMTYLMMAGFIERVEQTKRCQCCGAPKFDYAFYRVTGGGRLFVAAMERSQ